MQFDNNINQAQYSNYVDANASSDIIGLNKYLTKVFMYLATGIGIAALMSYLSIRLGWVNALYTWQGGVPVAVSGLGKVVPWLPLVAIFVISFSANRMSAQGLKNAYYGFTALMGYSISALMAVVVAVNPAVAVQALLITTLDLAIMWAIAYNTKKDLRPMGSFLMMAMWGIFLVGIFSMIFGSTLGIWYSYAIVLIFSGLIAYDIQKIKYFYLSNGSQGETADKVAVFAAMSLFIDFVNIFLAILRILMSSRD
ncbi:MAG: Bax inhibitor-1/YccA family protein [Alphaproteobacteria bacterium]|jgi:FtsH-binding integral membrane protein|nr:Bax inhibitor-1/YccA family protein [Alphaproteobacteria bacterium]